MLCGSSNNLRVFMLFGHYVENGPKIFHYANKNGSKCTAGLLTRLPSDFFFSPDIINHRFQFRLIQSEFHHLRTSLALVWRLY